MKKDGATVSIDVLAKICTALNCTMDDIYGTDANPRMARTSKMNMIMHGDGHGGVHHHDRRSTKRSYPLLKIKCSGTTTS